MKVGGARSGRGGGNYLSVGEMGKAYLVVLLHMHARACMPLPNDNSYGSISLESTVPCRFGAPPFQSRFQRVRSAESWHRPQPCAGGGCASQTSSPGLRHPSF